jgi:hypothetical protein
MTKAIGGTRRQAIRNFTARQANLSSPQGHRELREPIRNPRMFEKVVSPLRVEIALGALFGPPCKGTGIIRLYINK